MATSEATPSPEKKRSPVPISTRGGSYYWETSESGEYEVEHLRPSIDYYTYGPSKPEETEPKEVERHLLQDPQKRKEGPLTEQAGPRFMQSLALPRGKVGSISSSKGTEERQHGRKFWHFGLPKFVKRGHMYSGQLGQQPVGSVAKCMVQSPTHSPYGKSSKSLSPSPQSQKSPSPLWAPRGVPEQKVDVRIFVKPAQAGTPEVSRGVQSTSPPITNRLANITDKDFVPREVSTRFS